MKYGPNIPVFSPRRRLYPLSGGLHSNCERSELSYVKQDRRPEPDLATYMIQLLWPKLIGSRFRVQS